MESREAWKEWEAAHAKRVTASVNRLRSDRGWTVRELAIRLQRAGWPIEVATLNGILSGGKRGSFSVGEVFVLARALDVPPTYLMLGMSDGEGLPAEPLFSPDEASLASVYLWFVDSGMLLHDYRDTADAEREGFNLVQGWLGYLPRYATALDDVYWQNALWLASPGGDGATRQRGLSDALEDLRSVRTSWRDRQAQSEWTVPNVPPLPVSLGFIDDDEAPDPRAPIEHLNSTKQLETARAYWTSVSRARDNATRLDELAERKIERAQSADLDELLRIVVWLNSLLIEAPVSGARAADAIPEYRRDLVQGLTALKGLRRVRPHSDFDLEPLPAALAFLDEDADIETVQLPIEGLSNDEALSHARAHLALEQRKNIA